MKGGGHQAVFRSCSRGGQRRDTAFRVPGPVASRWPHGSQKHRTVGSACAGASRKHSSLRRAGPAVRGAGGTRALPRSLVRAAREAVGTQCAFGIVGRGDRAGKVPGWRSSPRRVWLGRPSTPRRAQALFSGVLEGEPPRGQGAELGLLAGPYTAFLRGPVEQSLQELNRATHGFSRLRVFDAVCLRGRARSGLSG